ncbi:MAG: hypothetical protein AAF078_05040, partial [Planctomycetota bacterium]
MPDAPPPPPFFGRLAQIINGGLARSVVLAGEVHDLFYSPSAHQGRGGYVPLVDYLCDRCAIPSLITLVYELNGPIRLLDGSTAKSANPTPDHSLPTWQKVRAAWVAWKLGASPDEITLRALTDKTTARQREVIEAEFDRNVMDVVGQPTVAFEFMRQLTHCSRAVDANGRPYLADHLLILVEAADMSLPAGNGDIAALPHPDRHRIAIVQDWFSDPGFMNGPDTVVLLAESASLIHPRVARLPATLTLSIDPPTTADRAHFVQHFLDQGGAPAEHDPANPTIPETDAPAAEPAPRVRLWSTVDALARASAGMSLHALRRLLLDAAHRDTPVSPDDVIQHVADFLANQLGEDVIEFKRPTHRLDAVVGATNLRGFLRDELIPRFRATGDDALPGAAVAGPIGGGKTF